MEKTKTTIRLNDMHFYAYHGWYEEERKIGGRYLVNVEVVLALKQDKHITDINQTVNYENIYAVTAEQMRIPATLLEEVVMRIGGSIRNLYPEIDLARVSLKKLDAPLGNHAGTTEVIMEF